MFLIIGSTIHRYEKEGDMISMIKVLMTLALPRCLIIFACESGTKKSAKDEEPLVDTDEAVTDTEPDVVPDNDSPEEIFCDVIYRFYDGNTQLCRSHNVEDRHRFPQHDGECGTQRERQR